jgi:hypothetical protein
MCPFGERNDPSNDEMEKALDGIANGDWKNKRASVGNAAVPSPFKKPLGNREGEHREQEERKAVTADAPAKPRKGKTRKVSPTAWSVNPYTTKRGVEGKLVKVGGWSIFIREGGEQAAIDSINTVFRSAAATALVAAIRG